MALTFLGWTLVLLQTPVSITCMLYLHLSIAADAIRNDISPGVHSFLAECPKEDSATNNQYSNKLLYMESVEIPSAIRMAWAR